MRIRKYLSPISIILVVIYTFFVYSCNYYKIKTIDTVSSKEILKQVKKTHKYIILHQGENAWHLNDIQVNQQSSELTATLEQVNQYHQHFKTVKKQSGNRYKSQKDKSNDPTYEVHLYSSEPIMNETNAITIPFSVINKIEVYGEDTGLTILSVLGISVAIGVVLAAIIVATKSSCPFVYTYNGNEFVFAGEIYGGAIYSSLERNDYLPLHGFEPMDNKYALRISNELKEKQYTNLANLIVVEHPELSNILIDKNGNIQTLSELTEPEMAYSGLNSDVKPILANRDSISYPFDKENPANNLSNLTLSFKKPVNAQTAKLVINGKNSYWLDYAYGKFTELFGVYYNKFAEEQKSVPAEKNLQWTLDQGIPLSVYLKTEDGWEFVDYFHSMGPLASRDLVMPINVSKVKGETVTLKLECGFMFWEIDYAAVDFSENTPFEVNILKPSSATDENGVDVSYLLTENDNLYLAQPEIGNVATIEFSAPQKKNNLQRTVFLHSRGYYEYIRDYKNWPDMIYLQSFKDKGSFTQFAKEHYKALSATDQLWASALNQTKEK